MHHRALPPTDKPHGLLEPLIDYACPPAEVPDAPTHANLVAKAYNGEAPREARPNANRGDNLTVGSPYQDTPAPAGASFGLSRKEA